ncbi:MAG: hypothetical protein FD143_2681 [Ignavibacteria bacterium]|nr:MAG: hypothetical protein FD143_2681 [Ignavibacteria bacterium]KAF0156809.1 MAG: hypothetical protein FD188_2873 [Ignavibacteria bacterium]
MKTKLFKIIAAVIAIIFSLLSIVEGSTVLLGISVQDYTVFKPLLVYNVIMGIVGVFAGSAIWINTREAMRYTKIILAAHTTVMVIVIFIYLLSNAVAMHSVQAMLVRVVIWLVITLLAWKSNQSVVNQKNVNK